MLASASLPLMLRGRLREAAALITATTTAAPAMSALISSKPRDFHKQIPPVLNVVPFPATKSVVFSPQYSAF